MHAIPPHDRAASFERVMCITVAQLCPEEDPVYFSPLSTAAHTISRRRELPRAF